jgi:hypothetical protein
LSKKPGKKTIHTSFHTIFPVFFLWLCTRFVFLFCCESRRFNESLALIVGTSSDGVNREPKRRVVSGLIPIISYYRYTYIKESIYIWFTSFPELVLRTWSFFSSITLCKRSVSISCSLLTTGVDGAPILLFDGDGRSVERFLICCSAAFISSTVTLCVDRRSRRAWAERCLRCASASSSRFNRRFASSTEFDDVVTVTFVAGGGSALVTLIDVVGTGVVDSLPPPPDRRRT